MVGEPWSQFREEQNVLGFLERNRKFFWNGLKTQKMSENTTREVKVPDPLETVLCSMPKS